MRRGHPVGNYYTNAPCYRLNPLFVNDGESTGSGADYHLQATSPIRDLGVTLGGVPNDYDRNRRPLGAGYSIGAFEK